MCRLRSAMMVEVRCFFAWSSERMSLHISCTMTSLSCALSLICLILLNSCVMDEVACSMASRVTLRLHECSRTSRVITSLYCFTCLRREDRNTSSLFPASDCSSGNDALMYEMGSKVGESSGSVDGSTSCRADCRAGEKVGRGREVEGGGGGEREAEVAAGAVSAADFCFSSCAYELGCAVAMAAHSRARERAAVNCAGVAATVTAVDASWCWR